MTKVSVVLYYWILIAAALLFARTAGLADNDSAIIKIIIVLTILYVGVVMISLSMGKKRAETGGTSRGRAKSDSLKGQRKMKK